jgi:hypothetical protein
MTDEHVRVAARADGGALEERLLAVLFPMGEQWPPVPRILSPAEVGRVRAALLHLLMALDVAEEFAPQHIEIVRPEAT